MRFLGLCSGLLALVPVSAAKEKFQAADFVNQHLSSIGTEQARAAVRNRLAQGTVVFRVVNRGPETWEGPATFVSEDDKLASLMKFPPTVYRTEWFVRNGKKISVGQIKPGTWSHFGQFVMTHNEILTEGLWGGTLSTGWALAHFEERQAKLQDRGLKKVDGRDLRRVDYIPKKSSDLEIQLYFEPDTLRHVMTVYLLEVSPGASSSPNASANEHEAYSRLEEKFADFKNVDNLQLPSRWTIQFTFGTQSSGTIDQYDVSEEKISHNVSLDPRNFEVK
jgi:hypothetical protein